MSYTDTLREICDNVVSSAIVASNALRKSASENEKHNGDLCIEEFVEDFRDTLDNVLDLEYYCDMYISESRYPIHFLIKGMVFVYVCFLKDESQLLKEKEKLIAFYFETYLPGILVAFNTDYGCKIYDLK